MAPFPYLPMAAIMFSLVSYVIVQISVFAYVGYMVEDLGVVRDKDQAGYYAGLLSSAFMIGHCCSAHFWGVISDRRGNRFVMVVGLVSTVVLSLSFGLATTFTWAFTSRFLLGLLNGMMAASKTLVAEVCGKKHEAAGMNVVTTSWSLGAILGPGIGGMLAQPAKHHPHTFSRLGIFGRYPYLLPNVVGAGLALLSLPLVLMFVKGRGPAVHGTPRDQVKLEYPVTVVPVIINRARVASPRPCAIDDVETPSPAPPCKRARLWRLVAWQSVGGDDDDDEAGESREADLTQVSTAVSKRQSMDDGGKQQSWVQVETVPMAGVIQSGDGEDALECIEEDLNPRSLLSQRHIRILLFIDGLYSFTYSGFNEVYALWSLSSVAKGGLDWSTAQIGQLFLACGVMVIVFNMLVLPSLTTRLGIKTSSRLGSVFEVPLYFVLPLLSWVNSAGHLVPFASLILRFTAAVCSNSFYTGIALALNNAPEAQRRGELNGISMAVDSFASAISPIVLSVLFAFSIDFNNPFPFDYHLVFYLLGTTRLTVGWLAWNRFGDSEGTDKHVFLPDDYPSSPRVQCSDGIELGMPRTDDPMDAQAPTKG